MFKWNKIPVQFQRSDVLHSSVSGAKRRFGNLFLKKAYFSLGSMKDSLLPISVWHVKRLKVGTPFGALGRWFGIRL